MNTNGYAILVIDDEVQIRRLLQVALTGHGYKVLEAPNGRDGLNEAAMRSPDLVILDLGLPDIDGLEVLRKLREWSQAPVIILSVREQENDKITALDCGADDYLTKPFSMGELLARIRAALRHATKTTTDPVLIFDDLSIDLSQRIVKLNQEEVKLTPTEYDLLKTLATHSGKVLTQKQLLHIVWGPGYEKDSHYLRIYVGQLRRKIEKDPSRPQHIITEPGIGYRFL